MAKQIHVSNNMIHRLDAIRSKYDQCSYTKAIEYLIAEDTSPNRFIRARLQEVGIMISKHFPDDDDIKGQNALLQEQGSRLVRRIHLKDREHLKYIEEQAELPVFSEVEE